MSILWRSWLTFTILIATVLVLLTILSTLQFDSVLSNLIRQRLSVIAQTTSSSFRPVAEMGLPISMMRNANKILQRAGKTDPQISSIHVFDAKTGAIVHSSRHNHPNEVSEDVLAAQAVSESTGWSSESAEKLNSGAKITTKQGQTVGNVVVIYPISELRVASVAIFESLGVMAAVLLLVFSTLSLLIVIFRLASAVEAVRCIQNIYSKLSESTNEKTTEFSSTSYSKRRLGLLFVGIENLGNYIINATRHYNEVRRHLKNPLDIDEPMKSDQMVSESDTSELSLARLIARQLIPWAGLVILGAALCFGIYSVREINRFVEPEIENRTRLIGSIISTNVQRAIDLGIPFENLVGGKQYIGHVLEDFPELTYVSIANSSGQTIIESGSSQNGGRTDAKNRDFDYVFPVRQENKTVGEIRLAINPSFINHQFRNVLLDFVVVILVAMLLAFEVMTKLISSSLTAPFEHLQRLVREQSTGKFSSVFAMRGRNPVFIMGRYLSNRAEELHALYIELLNSASSQSVKNSIRNIGERYGLSEKRPKPISLAFVNDIRLPLFIFVAAEELATPFLPLFAKSVSNPWPWVDENIIVSVPIVGYLFAILIISPFARDWADRLGHRRLFLIALIPATIDNLGLYYSTTITEVILWRTVTGIGYALATLACQDYVLDVVSSDRRSRALGVFVSVVIAATFCGTAVGGVLADRLGPRIVFLIGAGLISIAGLLAWNFLARHLSQQYKRKEGTKFRFSDIGKTMLNGRFSALVLGVAIPANILMAAILWYIVPLAMNAAGASTADIGRTLMLYYLVILVASPIFVRLADERFGAVNVIGLGGALSGVSLLLPAIWSSPAAIVIAVIGVGFGHSMIRAPSVAVALRIAEIELDNIGPGVVLGTLRALERAGCIVGLIVIAGYTSFVGYDQAITATGIVILIGNLIFLMKMRISMDKRYSS